MMKKIAVEMMILAAIGAMLAFFGPFGSFDLPLGQRLLSWIGVILIGFPLFRLAGITARAIAEATRLPQIVATLLTVMVVALPMTSVVAAIFWQMSPTQALGSSYFAELYGQVVLVAMLVMGVSQLLQREMPAHDDGADDPPVEDDIADLPPPDTAPEPTPEPMPEPTPQPTVPLDIPPGFGPVIALKGEDHYVRFFGEGKTHLALMRLRDAMAMMPDDAGLQVHRSWWVAKSAIASASRDGRGVILTLHDGTSVPVARDKMAEVRAAGWL